MPQDRQDMPYLSAYDPWRGLVSALAWIERGHAARAIEHLIETPRPRTRWLAVAACGMRRMAHMSELETALVDPEPLVRARAARTAGELGRLDLRDVLNTLLEDPDGDCRFWGAWAATRLGAARGVRVLAEFATGRDRRADLALDHLLRCLSIDRANALLRQLSRDPRRHLAFIRSLSAIGDVACVPWLLDQLDNPVVARAAGDTFATLTGAEIGDLARSAPPDVPSQPSDDPADDDVEVDPDDGLEWPDPKKLQMWWQTNGNSFRPGIAYFLGAPKEAANWIAVLNGASQGCRRAAAFELALRRPGEAMFEVRARGDLQRRLLKRAGGVSLTGPTANIRHHLHRPLARNLAPGP